MKEKFYTAWITVNRACNLRCKWCYAYGTGFKKNDDMNFEKAKKIVDICSDLSVRRIIIIGGEPTLYTHIYELISYIKSKNIKSIVVTNGILLAQKDTLKKFIESGVHGFSMSIKAHNREDYLETTGFDCFETLLTAVDNLSELKVNFSLSQVITSENIPTISEGVKIFKEHGAKKFSFGFCYNFNCNNQNSNDFIKNNNPYELAYLFKKYYANIENSLAGCYFNLSQGLPLCVWDDDIIQTMSAKKQLSSLCQLVSGGGLLFDTDGSLIPCNAMYELKYGKYGVDFIDAKTLLEFRKTPDVENLFKKLRGIPDYKCQTCEKAKNCGGGCVTHWTNYNFKDFEGYIKDEFIEKLKNQQ